MKRDEYLIVLDKRNPTFGRVELKAIEEVKNVQIELQGKGEEKSREWVRGQDKAMRDLNERSTFIKQVYKVLGPLQDLTPEVLKDTFRSKALSHQGLPGTFRVDITKELLSSKTERKKLIKNCAESIKNKTHAEVSLSTPHTIFCPLLTNEGLMLSAKVPPLRKDFRHREPRYRPYSPSVTMEAKLSRYLVNLARATAGKTFLDPFCGSGSFVLEAASIGAKTMGCDRSKKHLHGARWNAQFYQLASKIRLKQADATHLPFADDSIWSIASDLPYGRAAGLYGRKIEELYRKFLKEARRILEPHRYLAFCASSAITSLNLQKWKKRFHSRMDLSGDLTRHLLVLQRSES